MSGVITAEIRCDTPQNEHHAGFSLYSAGIQFFITASPQEFSRTIARFVKDRGDILPTTHVIHGSHTFFDSIHTLLTEQIASSGRSIYCTTGCSACCKQVILSNPFEAALIGFNLARDKEKLERFLERYAGWDAETKAMRSRFPGWAARRALHGVDDGSFDQMEFTAHCPFLADDLCQIYPWRPYGCRSYLALSESCIRPSEPGQRPGRQGMGIGMSTSFHQRRQQLLGLLWQAFGVDPAKTRGHFLPDLVKHFLDGDIAGLLARCRLP